MKAKEGGRSFSIDKPEGAQSSRGRGGHGRGGWAPRGRGRTSYPTEVLGVYAILQDCYEGPTETEEDEDEAGGTMETRDQGKNEALRKDRSFIRGP